MAKSRKSLIAAFSMLALLLAAAGGKAWAKDAVQISIPLAGAPGAIQIDENGNPYAPGTFAVGTIKVHYTAIGNSWVPGEFAELVLNVKIKPGKPKPPTNYPVDVTFRQAGSGLILEVTNCVDVNNTHFSGSTLTVYGNDAEANCNVKVTIPSVDPAMNFDGAMLVGNLRMDTPPGSHLDTVPLVQVRAMLVFPTSCLRLFNMITDNGITQVVENLSIGIRGLSSNPENRRGEIQNTSPANLADVVYLVNTCTQNYYVDIKINLQGHFAPNPSPPGNSVTFFSSQAFNPETQGITDAFSSFNDLNEAEQGAQSKCIVNRLVAAESTLLVRARMALASSVDHYTDLPGPPSEISPSGTFQSFTSQVSVPNTTCGALHADADPNAITLPLDFEVSGW